MNQPPGPAGWPPPPAPPPPPRRKGGLIIVVVVGLVIVAVVAIGVIVGVIADVRDGTLPGLDRSPAPHGSTRPTPTTPTPTPTPTLPPTPTDPPPEDPKSGLTKNALYDLELERGEGDCSLKVRRPKPPLKDSKLGSYLEEVVDCLVEVYADPFDEIGFELSTPKVRTYAKEIDSPCGELDQDGSPAYYCSSDATIYWPETSDDDRQAYTFARLGYVGLMAHEFGHHLQSETGMFHEYSYAWSEASDKKQLELSRRLELQAQCFEGVFLSYAKDAIDMDSDDLYEIREWHSYTGDEDPPDDRVADHGTSKAQYRWLLRGYESTDFGRCNTWSASTKSVK